MNIQNKTIETLAPYNVVEATLAVRDIWHKVLRFVIAIHALTLRVALKRYVSVKQIKRTAHNVLLLTRMPEFIHTCIHARTA
eukprot:SAG11_NODE_27890_length_327_cov_1.429825_1_plen_81_part_01